MKFRGGGSGGGGGDGGPGGGSSSQDRPYYPITSKLLRVVSILVLEYHDVRHKNTRLKGGKITQNF